MYARSPELMNPEDTMLCVVDVQEKLLKTIPDAAAVCWNIRRLLDASRALQVAAVTTEQYPAGLGPTARDLLERTYDPIEKLTFSCVAADGFRERLRQLTPKNILLVGLEAHVCVQQTALDLIAEGFRVFLAVDAVASRQEVDREIALRRMEASGVTLTTVEAVIFEWCFAAGSEGFRAIRPLVMEKRPAG